MLKLNAIRSRTTRLSVRVKHRNKSRTVHCQSNRNVLVIGGGGREHALCWKLVQSETCKSLYCTPGNAGILREPAVLKTPIRDIANHDQVIEFCEESKIDLVVIGPEAPLVSGLVDDLAQRGIMAFGPTREAAQLEGSKSYMKELCREFGVPTARYEVFDDLNAAKDYVRTHGAPIVVKVDGLAAGKGAIVCRSEEEAMIAIDRIMTENEFGAAGDKIVIEEFLEGEEASYFALIDGNTVIPLTSAQDHKAIGDGDVGENTGGMGAYSPAPIVTPEIERAILSDIIQPTASGMVSRGTPFRGVLFAGLMIADSKAKLLEYNVRWGDPECQSIVVRMDFDLLETMIRTCEGRLETVGNLNWAEDCSLTVVMAAKGYPGKYRKGSLISKLDSVEEAKVFHAGTALDEEGRYVSNGGRVLGVTALGKTVCEAQRRAYKAVNFIDWPDGYFRGDIGYRAVRESGLNNFKV